MRELKFTLKDILLLLDPNGECEEQIILSEQPETDTWVIAPANSSVIWTKENLERKVEGLGIWDGKLQIWLADLSEEPRKNIKELFADFDGEYESVEKVLG